MSFYVGARGFDEDDYEPVELHGVLAAEYSHEGAGAPVGFEVGLALSGDENEVAGTDIEMATGELYAGVRKTFGSGSVHPLVGFGLAYIHAAIDGGPDEDDGSLAGYVHGGLAFDVGRHISLGIDARILFGSEVEFGGAPETDIDYGQLALVFGVGL
jgi:hypothetical protein